MRVSYSEGKRHDANPSANLSREDDVSPKIAREGCYMVGIEGALRCCTVSATQRQHAKVPHQFVSLGIRDNGAPMQD